MSAGRMAMDNSSLGFDTDFDMIYNVGSMDLADVLNQVWRYHNPHMQVCGWRFVLAVGVDGLDTYS